MNKDVYQELLLRFAKELNDVGVTDDMKSLISDGYNRTPNISSVATDRNIKRFLYRHNGYEIEAIQNIKISVKKIS
tara:strand:- start:2401 stop:2628 length:228 start_codon:yes stop_codon:yes gene_type:complete